MQALSRYVFRRNGNDSEFRLEPPGLREELRIASRMAFETIDFEAAACGRSVVVLLAEFCFNIKPDARNQFKFQSRLNAFSDGPHQLFRNRPLHFLARFERRHRSLTAASAASVAVFNDLESGHRQPVSISLEEPPNHSLVTSVAGLERSGRTGWPISGGLIDEFYSEVSPPLHHLCPEIRNSAEDGGITHDRIARS